MSSREACLESQGGTEGPSPDSGFLSLNFFMVSVMHRLHGNPRAQAEA